jgi:four helix bundle protein
LIDQFGRASRSVASNIAEAWRKRRYPGAFVSKISDAEGEAAECQTWAEFSLRCRYLSEHEAKDLDRAYEQIIAQLITMIDQPENWTFSANRRVGTSR